MGALAIKKSREDRKLEEVIKLIEKMEEKEIARKSSSQEDGILYSLGLGSFTYLISSVLLILHNLIDYPCYQLKCQFVESLAWIITYGYIVWRFFLHQKPNLT